ncbi:hypothetical protein NE865_11579 [Phthorimaea operculella]|nr:hypothetical protein NE865_11579 [Phthorimaea operculella]
MSDSSEDDDLSRFKDVVDSSFTDSLQQSQGKSETTLKTELRKPKSERYLEEASHYNDVKVPEEMQKRIGAKVSAIISKNIEFVELEQNGVKKRKIKGGVKLFHNSEGFLSAEEAKDTYTEGHNREAKKMKRKIKEIENNNLEEDEKIKAVTVSGDYVLSKEETKLWKSRRKEKLFKYKGLRHWS